LNVHIENANFAKLTSMHFYGWKKGLKTGMYYLRTKAATDAIKFTVDKAQLGQPTEKTEEMSPEDYKKMVEVARVASENGDDCDMCSG